MKNTANKPSIQNGSASLPPVGKEEGAPSGEIQAYDTIVRLPLALDIKTCAGSAKNLNQLLADTMTLRDLYKKHHWQVSGPTFQQLHLLFDKHWTEQGLLVDLLAERIQTLGGVALAMAADVADTTLIPRAPRGREGVRAQAGRLLHAHEIVLEETRSMARWAGQSGDEGTVDILVSNVIRVNELQVWFVSQHLVTDSMPREETSTIPALDSVVSAPHPSGAVESGLKK